VLHDPRCRNSWLTKLVVTEERVKAFFGQRNQKDKLAASISNQAAKSESKKRIAEAEGATSSTPLEPKRGKT
jgi:pyridoxine/pyridoxamine 5'-phosphate oxidase